MQRFSLVLIFLLVIVTAPARAETVRVAVASNFYSTMKSLSELFEQSTGYQVELVVGSSGKLASQIIQGAPYDLFLSADVERPRHLEEFGVAVEDSRATYALGRLVLLHRDSIANVYRRPVNDHESLIGLFRQDNKGRIASANPRLAPYGRATKRTLDDMKLSSGGRLDIDSRLVYGENVSQAFHFLKTGNVDWAFVAMSQAMENGIKEFNFSIMENHEPINQQMLLLSPSAAAKDLHQYILSLPSQRLISQSGYDAVFELNE